MEIKKLEVLKRLNRSYQKYYTDQASAETVRRRRARCGIAQKEEKSWATGSSIFLFLLGLK